MTMLRLKHILIDIFSKHILAAIEEAASVLDDELDRRTFDRVQDLRAQ
jgi:hypothetical protein